MQIVFIFVGISGNFNSIRIKMKNIVIKGILVIFTAMLAQADVIGQRGQYIPGQYGNTPEDSIRCLRNLSLYGDRHRQGNFDEALPYWRMLFNEFPLSSRNIYIWGEPLMSHMIENAETEEEKKAYLDTAMMMFDQRMEYYPDDGFGDPANVLGRKGRFYLQHNRNIEEAGPGYQALKESIELSGDDPSPAIVVLFMNVTIGKFRAGILENEQVIETYSYLIEKVESGLEKSPADRLYNARDIIEQLFADSGAADCDALIRLFAGQVTESPDDVDLLNKVNGLLTGANCTDSELYLMVTEKMHVLDPSPRSALNLSAMYRGLNNNDQVVRYLKEAVDLQEDEVERASYYLELAIIANQVKQDRQLSRQYALQALNDNPSLGRAHLLIGSLYASESNCFANDEDAEFKKRTVYWAAVDRFIQAKRVDPSVSSEADQMIETYSFYFPDNETIFFHGYTEGETYTVGCWINETTRIRARSQ